MTGFEYLGYLVGGFLYLSSNGFRTRKQREWESTGARYRIYEVGMWVTIPLITLILITVAVMI